MRFYYEKVEACRNFCNKLWNAARFILMNLENMQGRPLKPDGLEVADKWIISRYNHLAEEVTNNRTNMSWGLQLRKYMILHGMNSATGI